MSTHPTELTPQASPLTAFSELLKAITTGVPPRYRPILIVIVVIAFVPIFAMSIFERDVAEILVAILGLCGTIFLFSHTALAKHRGRLDPRAVSLGLWGATLIIVYSLAVIVLIRPPAPKKAGTVLTPTYIDPRALPPDDPSPQPDSVKIFGNVRYGDNNNGVEGAYVNVNGFGSRSDTTDVNGFFEIDIPYELTVIGRRRVSLGITLGATQLFAGSVDSVPFHVPMIRPDPPIQSASSRYRADDVRVSLTHSGGIPSRSGGEPNRGAESLTRPGRLQEPPELRLILDSIRTVQDGSTSGTRWRFDVSVNGRSSITLRNSWYNQQGRWRRVLVAGEVPVTAGPSQAISLEILGIHASLFGDRRIVGSLQIPWQELDPESPVRRDIQVTKRGEENKGEFIFFFTVIRRGLPDAGSPNSSGGFYLIHQI